MKEDKIKAIYEKIADKTLSFGCRIRYIREHSNEGVVIRKVKNYNEKSWEIQLCRIYDNWIFADFVIKKHQITILDIIWHPVMIWDILAYYKYIDWNDYPTWFNITIEIVEIWKQKRLSIEEQSEECINYIYNLITNE